MAYEPSGKVKPFIDAVRREPTRICKPAEVAIMIGCQQSSVGSWLDYSMKQHAVHRGKQVGQVVYSGQPFPPEAAFPHPAERNAAAAPRDIRVPKFGENWTPPKMTAPRPGSDIPVPARAPGSPPAAAAEREPLCKGCTRGICWEKGCVAGKVSHLIESSAPAATPAPTPTPTPAPAPAPTAPPEPAPVLADASMQEDAGAEVDDEPDATAEADPFDFCTWKDGGLQVWGAEQFEDGSFKLSAQQLFAIRRATAWMPPPREEVQA